MARKATHEGKCPHCGKWFALTPNGGRLWTHGYLWGPPRGEKFTIRCPGARRLPTETRKKR